MKDRDYELQGVAIALGGALPDPDTPEPNQGRDGAPIDIPAYLAQKLSDNETMRSGNFSPKQFKHLCENILRYELHKLEKERK